MLGALLGMLFLARLDMVFVIIAALVLLGWVGRAQPLAIRSRQFAWLLLGLACVAAPYLLHNAIQSGDIVPVSGRLKSAFPQVALFSHGVPPIPAIATAGMLVSLAASLWLWQCARSRDNLTVLLMGWSIGNLLHWLHTLLFMKWGILVSHFASYWVPLIGVAPLLLKASAQSQRFWQGWLVGLGVMAALIWAWHDVHACYRLRFLSPVHWRTSMYNAALWARQHTPLDAVFGMTDSGIFGYYSGRTVINLDGVVNNREYQQYLYRRQLGEYLRRNRVQYLVVYVVPDLPRFPTPSQQGARYADVYRGAYRAFRFCAHARMYGDIPSDEIILYRPNEVYRERHIRGMLIIWRISE